MNTTTAPPPTITSATADHITTITLNRPETYNAFSNQFSSELLAALRAAARARDVRVVIITGAGKAFSSGQDLAELKERYKPGYVPALAEDINTRYNPIIRAVRFMEKPVIAAVNGVAAGAGCALALACDLRVAARSASFIEAFVNVGLIPDSGSTFFLPRLVGHARAMELCCTGRKVDAEEALRLGLVNEVVDDAALMDAARKLAAKLAAMPARGIALTKRLFTQSWTRSLDEQLDAEAFAQDTAGRTKDHFEGVAAFLEKRKPVFTGD